MTTYERFQFTRQRTKPIASISSLRHQLYYWKKIHWTCKWIILIEWRLLKKYVTCLHRDAVRKTDVHSFFFFFFFLALYLWDSETRLYYCSESILSSVRQDELRQKILTVNERFSVPNLGQIPPKKKKPGILERYQKHTSIVSCLSKGIPGTVVLRLNSP